MPTKRLGQYELHEPLGQGAFATVYRATHITLQNEVALKVIDPGRAGDKDTRERLIREAQTASQLEHPNIMRVFDMDEQNGQVFIAMEYIRGGDLANWRKQNPVVSWRRVVEILRQIAAALDYAHQKAVLHRDVKPQNILLDTKGNAHLGDFGLVRALDAPRLTQVGVVVGTPTYMSPEQVEDRKLDGRSDQYSLAVIAYEFLVGRPPFRSESSQSALLIMHVEQPPPRPSELNPQIPPEADDILLKALSKKPDERYATCAEFVRALESAYTTSEIRRYRELLQEARTSATQGQFAAAHEKLKAAATLMPDRPDLAEALAELEQTQLHAEGYAQGVKSWQQAQQQAQNVLDLFVDYPDPQGIFVTLGLRQPPPPPLWERLQQVVIGLLVGAAAAAFLWYLAFLWITRVGG